MEFLIEFLSDALFDLTGGRIFKTIQSRIQNRVLRGFLYTLTVVFLIAFWIGLAYSVLWLVQFIFA